MDSKEWFRRAVIYQVFIERFNGVRTKMNTTEFLGGNLRGVTGKLDYLEGLGISVIWLSPFCESLSYHGYHITDFRKVDPHFGVLDFTLAGILGEAVSGGLDPLTDPAVRRRISRHLGKVPPGYMMVTFLDNHDMNRFVRYCNGDVYLLLRAFETLFSLDYSVSFFASQVWPVFYFQALRIRGKLINPSYSKENPRYSSILFLFLMYQSPYPAKGPFSENGR